MSEPEIARRCPKCGASIRVATFFCPQCGAELKRQDSEGLQPQTTPATSEANETDPEVAAVNQSKTELGSETLIERRNESKKERRSKLGSGTLIEKRGESKKESRPNSEPETRNSELETQKEEAVKAQEPEAARASRGKAARGAMGAQIQRATTLARDVEDDVIHRARKVREISSVVLDEAGDDPSLRFVLVAAVLFLVFLIIVVMNRFIN